MSNKKMGAHPTGQHGAKSAGKEAPGKRLDQYDLAADIKGDNDLQGNDQSNVPNQRQAQAEARGETDELMESFKKLDKTYRAEAARRERAGDDDRE